MRIIGGKDYYDSANYGIDEEIMFIRDGKVPENIGFDDFPFEPRNWERGAFKPSEKDTPCLSLDYVLFAGNVYPVMRVIYPYEEKRNAAGHMWRQIMPPPHVDLFDKKQTWDDLKVEYIYDVASAEEMFKRAEGKVEFRSLFSRRFDMSIFDHFATKNPKWTQWLIERGIVTGYIHSKTMSHDIEPPAHQKSSLKKIFREMVSVRVNEDILEAVQFTRVKDAFTAKQEIAQYIGGVLPANQRPTVELTDLDRVQKAGFDKKTSFRKAPTKR